MQISDDYIRGVVEGEGCFTFCTTGRSVSVYKPKIPTFVLRMHERDKLLIQSVKCRLAPKNRVYTYRMPALHTTKKIYQRGCQSMLIVRDVGQLKNKIVPFFCNKLHGNKGIQFMEWLEKSDMTP